MESLYPGITIADANGVFVYIGKSCENFFSVSADFLLGRRADDPEIERIFHPCVTKMVLDSKEKVVTTQKGNARENSLVTGIPVFNQEGKLRMIVVSSFWEVHNYDDLKKKFDLLQKKNERLLRRLNQMTKEESHISSLINKSQASKDCSRVLNIFSERGLPAYICGPRGSGKKYIARAAYGKQKMLFDYNCRLMKPDLIEMELFGQNGFFSQAEDDTAVLENIEYLTPDLQQKLIDCVKHASITLIGISEFTLDELMEMQKLTDSFYNYFKSYQIQLSPLCERREDLSGFITYFLKYYNEIYNRNVSFTPRSMGVLLSYAWPGNINEVKNLIERIVLTAPTNRVDMYDLPATICNQSSELYQPDTSLKDMMDLYEQRIVTDAYRKYGTSIGVAKYLGISQASASRKIQKYVNTH